MSETRREALRLLGTITATCAFPFASDELYGQHVHLAPDQAAAAGAAPSFFTQPEYAALSRLVDVLIPPTDTPGAAAAGVPEYIDRVVTLNTQHQPLARAGLAWLTGEAKRRFGRDYASLEEPQHVALLQPLSDAVDREAKEQQQARYRVTQRGRTYYFAVNDATPPARPAVAVKNDPSDPDDARALLPSGQESDGGWLLHVARRPGRGAGLLRQHVSRELSLVRRQGALSRSIASRV